MDIGSRTIQDLVERPGESLSVEIKRWISPDEPEGVAKIARTALALRNHGGGFLLIGFDNDTLQPDTNNAPPDVEIIFHIDKIQGIVSKYASDPFEVSVEFGERDGQLYPVIVIPPGVKTPVASKSDLLAKNPNDKKLVEADSIFVRSLRANNTPSTTRASWKDWPKIVEVCFDNREADIGRFLRRHLSGITPEALRELAATISESVQPKATTEDLLRGYLQKSGDRFQEVLTERPLALPEYGSWEVALLLLGEVPTHSANDQFLNLLGASNPSYTGWPPWLDSRGFTNQTAQPYVYNGGWEALIVSVGNKQSNHIDFMRLDPHGKFYLRRALEDDISANTRAPEPLSALDFGLPIIRTAEAIAVGISFAKAMGCTPEKCHLAFAFRWSRLRGRELSAWVQPERYISPGRHAYQDDVTVYVDVPLDVPLSALGEFVHRAVQPLYAVFGGFDLGQVAVEDLTARLLERRL